MNIFITGASGSMAHYLIEHIRQVEPSARIMGLARSGGVAGLAYYSFNLWANSTHYLSTILRDAQPDYLFHLASEAHVGESFDRPGDFVYSNIVGTLNLYEALRRCVELRPRVILASTSEVYGNVPRARQPILETEPFAPVNTYAITKCAQEHLARFYMKAYGIPVVITRAFGYVNPRRDDLFLTAMAKQLVSSVGTIRHGNLKPVRTFCDVRDIAEAYWLAAKKGTPGEAYNIGSTDGHRLDSFLVRLINLSGRETNMELDQALVRQTDIDRCIPDTLKFRHTTGWQPKINLDESLKWLLANVGN